MNAAKVEKWVWLLIYGGLLVDGLGLAVRRTDQGLGLGLIAFGSVLVVVGIVLIYVRSRLKDQP